MFLCFCKLILYMYQQIIFLHHEDQNAGQTFCFCDRINKLGEHFFIKWPFCIPKNSFIASILSVGYNIKYLN